MSNEPITVRKGEVPKSEIIVSPDSPKHRRIRIALYVFASFPMILTILLGGEIGPPLLFLVIVVGIAYGCVRPGKSYRLVERRDARTPAGATLSRTAAEEEHRGRQWHTSGS